MRDDRYLGPPVAPFDLPAGWSPSAWAYRNLLGQDKEHSPRGTNSSTQTLAASGSVNPLAQLVLVTGTATATLESAVAADRRWHLFIHDIAAGGTVTVAGTPTINGAASVAIATRYACLMVWSDGTEWKAQQTDLSTALGTLAVAHGGTGATTAAGARTNLGLDNLLIPLLSEGGYKFDGATYLDSNALTGIANSKKFTWVGIVRFANAASAVENLMHSTTTRFQIRRTSTGAIGVMAASAVPTNLLDIVTSSTPCSAAGTYVILISVDLTTSGSSRIYVNDVSQGITVNTFTNTNIDFTANEYSIAATTAGANFFTGDFYRVWFDPTSNLEFNTESIRRRFADVDNTPVGLGKNGELPTGSIPILFLGYDTYINWAKNRGSAVGTTFTENGTPAAVTTALKGQYQHRMIVSECSQLVDVDYTVTYGNNAMVVEGFGPSAGIEVNIPPGTELVVL